MATATATRKGSSVENATRKGVKVSMERVYTLKVNEEQLALLIEGMGATKGKWRVLADTPANRAKAPDLLSGGLAKMVGYRKAKPEFLKRHALHEALKSLVTK